MEYLIHSHKETCIDHFFPKLMDLGFRAGMPAFDERMWPLREVFQYLLTQNDAPGYYFRLMLHRFFFMAGYAHAEAVASMRKRLDALCNAARERVLDIYRDENGLPQKPRRWA